MEATVRKRFFHDISGTSSSEYALILALVGVGMGGAFLALGGNLNGAMVNAKANMAATVVGGSSG